MSFSRTKFFLVFIPLFIVTVGFSQNLTRYTYYEGGSQIKEIYHVKSENSVVLEGKYISYYINGEVESQGTFHNNNAVGEWKFYFETGQLKMKMNVLDDNSGYWEYYYESGSKIMDGIIEDEKRQGKWKYYFESGTLRREGNYEDNKMEGRWVFYHEDGSIKGLIEYQANKGHYQEFYSTGELLGEGPKSGLLNTGEWKFYYKTIPGSLLKLRARGSYLNGKKTGEWEYFYEDGKLYSQGDYRIDKPSGEWIYYHGNQKVARKGEYDNGQKNGEWESFYSDGTLAGRTNLTQGSGIHREYYRNGQIKLEGRVENGLNQGLWKYFYDNGKLEGECEFDQGKGTYFGYYPDGTLKTKGEIQDGKRIGTWELYKKDGKLSGYYRPFYDQKDDTVDLFNISPPVVNRESFNYTEEENPKIRYFAPMENEFHGLIVGTNPLFLFAGKIPVALEYYIEDRLGHEFELESIRDPYFIRDMDIPINEVYSRGYSLSVRQKFYNQSDNPGLWYFGHDLQFTNLSHHANVYLQTPPDEPTQITATEQSFRYHFIFGYKLMMNTGAPGLSIDAFAGAGIGYREFSVDDDNSASFLEFPKNKVPFSFRFGFNFGHLFSFGR